LKHALALIAALAAPQAQALSCMRPDPILTLQQVMADPDPWVVLLGDLTYDDADVPPPWDAANANPPDYAPFAAMFNGQGLSPAGFDRPFTGQVLMQIQCTGPWCGGPPGQAAFLIFARVLPDGRYSIPLSPCAQHVFGVPDPSVQHAIVDCLNGGPCEPVNG
jgi:hypothetical protein